MRMIREILRLHHSCGLSKNKISIALGCARSTVREYIGRAQAAGVTWPLPEELDDDDLLEKHLSQTPSENKRSQPDCNYIHQELKKKGVTLALLWEEYKQEHPEGYQQTQFCDIYRQWRKTIDLVNASLLTLFSKHYPRFFCLMMNERRDPLYMGLDIHVIRMRRHSCNVSLINTVRTPHLKSSIGWRNAVMEPCNE